ncbi:hypothetical protein AAC387_Pa04g1950 [Persea americana]
MKTALHGIVIGPPHGSPNSSFDIPKSSMKMGLLRNANGITKRFPSALYTTKWPLSATGFLLDSCCTSSPDLSIEIRLLPMVACLCQFFTISTSLLRLIMVQ